MPIPPKGVSFFGRALGRSPLLEIAFACERGTEQRRASTCFVADRFSLPHFPFNPGP